MMPPRTPRTPRTTHARGSCPPRSSSPTRPRSTVASGTSRTSRIIHSTAVCADARAQQEQRAPTGFARPRALEARRRRAPEARTRCSPSNPRPPFASTRTTSTGSRSARAEFSGSVGGQLSPQPPWSLNLPTPVEKTPILGCWRSTPPTSTSSPRTRTVRRRSTESTDVVASPSRSPRPSAINTFVPRRSWSAARTCTFRTATCSRAPRSRGQWSEPRRPRSTSTAQYGPAAANRGWPCSVADEAPAINLRGRAVPVRATPVEAP